MLEGNLIPQMDRPTRTRRKSVDVSAIRLRPRRESLQELLQRAAITEWDGLLVGDGSGSVKEGHCGWSVVVIDRVSRSRHLLYGGFSSGVICEAELLPYILGMHYYDKHYRTSIQQPMRKIAIITDNVSVASLGEQACRIRDPLPKTMTALLAPFRQFRSIGYEFKWRWMKRKTNEFNTAADLVAGLSRGAMIRSRDGGADQALEALKLLEFQSPQAFSLEELKSLHPDN